MAARVRRAYHANSKYRYQLERKTPMPLLNVVLTLVVVGVLLGLINTYIPMQGTIKSIINLVVVIAVVLWLLYGYGIISHSGDVHLPSFH